MSNQQKTVFITGGSTGIGAASVRKFAQSGWNVAFMDINVEDGQAVANETGAFLSRETPEIVKTSRKQSRQQLKSTVNWIALLPMPGYTVATRCSQSAKKSLI